MELCAIKSEKWFYEFIHIKLCYQSKEEKTMVNKKFWLGMLVLALVFGLTVVGLTSCDDDLWSQEGSFTMTGSEYLKDGNDYYYFFENYSLQHDVKITIDDVTQTIKRASSMAGYGPTRLEIKNSSKTITVTYSPSNNVSYKSPGSGGSWEGGMEVQFWDK